ncbi:MAG: hypothetical protein H6715_04640 [Myxococcales bacterium]|nr:hypothetical protein [Myxococcales bacterium]
MRSSVALCIVAPLAHTLSQKFDVTQSITELMNMRTGTLAGSLGFLGFLIGGFCTFGLGDALYRKNPFQAGMYTAILRYASVARLLICKLVCQLLVIIVGAAIGLSLHHLTRALPDPRMHDLSLVALGVVSSVALWFIGLWHATARAFVIAERYTCLPSLREAPSLVSRRALHRYLGWSVAALGLWAVAIALGLVDLGSPWILMAGQQAFVLGTSLCQIGQLQAMLTNVDLYP